MDTSSIIIGVALVVVFVLLIWFSNYKRNQKQKKRLEKLKNFAEKQGFQISESENINDIVLGIDKVNNKVLFVKESKNIEITIDLQTIKKCDINEISRNVETHSGKQKVVDKIELLFYPIDNKNSNISLEFYNEANGDLQLSGEHQFLEKWIKIIDNQISKKK
jgi:hypothetical protein